MAPIGGTPQRQFFALLAMMVPASFAEVVSIGAVLPLLGMLTAPQRVFENQSLQPLMLLLYVRSPGQFLLPATLIFGVGCRAYQAFVVVVDNPPDLRDRC